ncbi:MAG: hypothetical protein LAT82_03515 [Nanoarchaeota archaeon]|nr:hypothetical protein [Nanoarchaeota archaeon]
MGNSQGLAIVCLLLNILLLPGLGSLIGGKKKEGIWQLVLVVISIPLAIVLIGFVTGLAAWIWGIITGIQIVKEADK